LDFCDENWFFVDSCNSKSSPLFFSLVWITQTFLALNIANTLIFQVKIGVKFPLALLFLSGVAVNNLGRKLDFTSEVQEYELEHPIFFG
jgi:hypothetical protein